MSDKVAEVLVGVVIVIAGLAVLAGGFVLLGLGVTAINRHSNDVDCDKMERSSGLPTHFDRQGIWSDGICYVDLPDGTSIPRELYYYEGSHP